MTEHKLVSPVTLEPGTYLLRWTVQPPTVCPTCGHESAATTFALVEAAAPHAVIAEITP